MLLAPINIFLNPTKNFTQSPVVPGSPKVLSTATLIQVTNNGIKFHPSAKDSCNHIRARPNFVLRPKQLTLVNDKCKELIEIGLAKPFSFRNGALSKVTAQNASEVTLTYHQDLICSPTNVPLPHTELSIAEPIRGISHINQIDSYSKWIKVDLTLKRMDTQLWQGGVG
ncbi:hypothetical protein ACTXT7_004468 [Hymenolepis weldensis]